MFEICRIDAIAQKQRADPLARLGGRAGRDAGEGAVGHARYTLPGAVRYINVTSQGFNAIESKSNELTSAYLAQGAHIPAAERTGSAIGERARNDVVDVARERWCCGDAAQSHFGSPPPPGFERAP